MRDFFCEFGFVRVFCLLLFGVSLVVDFIFIFFFKWVVSRDTGHEQVILW